MLEARKGGAPYLVSKPRRAVLRFLDLDPCRTICKGVGPPCSTTSSRAPWFSSSSKQKSRPPLTGIGRAAKGVLNQDAQTATPKEGRVSCEGHSEGYADGMAPLTAVRCKNIEHVERVSGSVSSSLKQVTEAFTMLVERHESSGNRNAS